MATIRTTVIDDVPRILALITEIFEEYDCVLDAEHEDTHLLDPGPYFRARGGDFWVVEDAVEIFATVALELHQDVGELRCLYIHAQHRRQGWGRKLSRMMIDLARRAGKQQMILWSDTRFEPGPSDSTARWASPRAARATCTTPTTPSNTASSSNSKGRLLLHHRPCSLDYLRNSHAAIIEFVIGRQGRFRNLPASDRIDSQRLDRGPRPARPLHC